MNILTPEQFKSNVEQWAYARGIYEHSTPFAQLMKATSEIGELCDAIIKDRTDDIKDAVGDIAVYLVNFAYMTDVDLYDAYCGFIFEYKEPYLASINREVSFLMLHLGQAFYQMDGVINDAGAEIDDCFVYLHRICLVLKIDFWECCTLAWNEIKDRKGKMVAGGAFVKEGDV